MEKVTNDMLTLASQMSVNKESKSASEESNKNNLQQNQRAPSRAEKIKPLPMI